MPRTSKEITADSHKLRKLMPHYADQPHVVASAQHAEKHGDKKALIKDRRIGAHLLRLEKLLSHEGVESRAWDSAVNELIINESNIPESYWKQQLQIARDNGHGDMTYLPERTKHAVAVQLQDAQRTGLESWRDYLEQAGDQYPLWFKLYAWEGMSQLGVFDKAAQKYRKRSKDTVAPYPQLNPAVLAKLYEMVSETDKSETFLTAYSRLLVEQKASLPTPENPEDVQGEWREYTKEDIEAITKAAQATPWCIAGKNMALHYTKDGGTFLLFHLQDPETGLFSPTACASIRLDADGNVVELSGLKGGSSQYLEDGLIPTVHDKVATLPGGDRYIQAFEDKQRLIEMDKKFQAGEPFTEDEIIFLYEVNRPISYIDTYSNDPRPGQFRRQREQHIEQMAKIYGSEPNAKLILDPIRSDDYYAKRRIKGFLSEGVDSDFLSDHLGAELKIANLNLLIEAGAHIDADELATQLSTGDKLQYFEVLKDAGASLTAEDIASTLSPEEKLKYFVALTSVGLELKADNLASEFDDSGKFEHLVALKKIGANFNVDELVVRKYGESEVIGLKGGISQGRMSFLLKGGASPELMLKMLKMAESQEEELFKEGGVYASSAVKTLNEIIKAVPRSGTDQKHFMDLFYKKLRDNSKTFVGNYGGGTYKFGDDFLNSGFDVNIVAMKVGIDDRTLDEFMKRGVDKKVVLDAITVDSGGRMFDGNEDNYSRTYYVSEKIAELVNYGCNIQDIARHIAKKYQFDVFDELQKYGAGLDLDAVVAGMRPQDVISRIAAIRERGVKVDIDAILRKANDNDVYDHMVGDLVKTGANPQLVGEKVGIRRYVDARYSGNYGSSELRYLESNAKEFPEVYKVVNERIAKGVQEKSAEQEELRRRHRERERAAAVSSN
jgi:hypothetical protein